MVFGHGQGSTTAAAAAGGGPPVPRQECCPNAPARRGIRAARRGPPSRHRSITPKGRARPRGAWKRPADWCGQFQQPPGSRRLGAASGRSGLVERENAGVARQDRFRNGDGRRTSSTPRVKSLWARLPARKGRRRDVQTHGLADEVLEVRQLLAVRGRRRRARAPAGRDAQVGEVGHGVAQDDALSPRGESPRRRRPAPAAPRAGPPSPSTSASPIARHQRADRLARDDRFPRRQLQGLPRRLQTQVHQPGQLKDHVAADVPLAEDLDGVIRDAQRAAEFLDARRKQAVDPIGVPLGQAAGAAKRRQKPQQVEAVLRGRKSPAQAPTAPTAGPRTPPARSGSGEGCRGPSPRARRQYRPGAGPGQVLPGGWRTRSAA